ncbi:hypothetical protein ACLX1H_006053 [Fusarium chlamydosporum]
MSALQTPVSPFEALPAEIILKVNSFCRFRDAARLARCNKKLYNLLITEIYKQTKAKGWFPLTFAACTNNLHTFHLCVQAGAPVDHYQKKDVGYHRWNNESFYYIGGWRPLREAIYRAKIESVKWLLSHGAVPDTTPEESVGRSAIASPLEFTFRLGQSNYNNRTIARVICIALLDAGADLTVLSAYVRQEIINM